MQARLASMSRAQPALLVRGVAVHLDSHWSVKCTQIWQSNQARNMTHPGEEARDCARTAGGRHPERRKVEGCMQAADYAGFRAAQGLSEYADTASMAALLGEALVAGGWRHASGAVQGQRMCSARRARGTWSRALWLGHRDGSAVLDRALRTAPAWPLASVEQRRAGRASRLNRQECPPASGADEREGLPACRRARTEEPPTAPSGYPFFPPDSTGPPAAPT